MPELCEIEYYRRAAEVVVGRTVTDVLAPDTWYCKRGSSPEKLRAVALGASVAGTRRHGKLLVLELDQGSRLGLRFGMTGRLIVDGTATIDQLEYDSRADKSAWDRFSLRFDGGGSLVIRDSRRLGGVEIDPDENRLGPDALTVTREQLSVALGASAAALKARLLDQTRLAGLGNLLTDEILWRCGIDPARPAGSLDGVEVDELASATRSTVASLLALGGSHRGRLQSQRHQGGTCPRCDVELQRRTVGGRTTYSCPRHQT